MLPAFNTTGPCFPDEHYMLPPERRLGRALRLIDEHKYFTLQAGRQVGKTTSAIWLVDHLRTGGRRAIWVDVETARENPNPATAFRTVLNAFDSSLSTGRAKGIDRPSRGEMEELLGDPSTALRKYLARLAAGDPRPLVVLVDEVDGLVGPTMVSFLTQLRDGYIRRREIPFPDSMVLIGQRHVRDYVLSAEDRQAVAWLGTTSPFNITAEAATIGSFTREEVGELVGQHTAVTGQRFEPAAIEHIYELTRGHPWLTNAIADQIANRDVEDRGVAITPAHVDAAKETIILERRTHIDSLVARLRDPRVRKVLEPMLVGEVPNFDAFDDDIAYARELGLVAVRGGSLEIANPIYREVLPRALTWAVQVSLYQETAWYVRPDGSLDMPKLMRAFQEFWRYDGHLVAEGFGYKEAGPHLLLMAFLQRVVNGGGRVHREYGLGRGALDLIVFWRDERYVIEVKLRRDRSTQAKALAQLGDYIDRAGLAEGWLVLFDRRKKSSWEAKLALRDVKRGGKRIHVVGC